MANGLTDGAVRRPTPGMYGSPVIQRRMAAGCRGIGNPPTRGIIKTSADPGESGFRGIGAAGGDGFPGTANNIR